MNPKTKIILFASPPPPFHGAGYAVQILLESSFSAHFNVMHIDCRYGTDLNTLSKFRLKKFFLVFKYLAVLSRAIVEFRPNYVIVCPTFGLGAFLKDSVFIIFIARVFRIKTLLWCHGSGLKELYDRSPKFFKRFIQYILNSADYIVPVSNRIAKDNYNYFVSESTLHPIHNGLPDNYIKPKSDREGKIKITFLTNMLNSKGWRILFEAAKKICVRNGNVEFNFYGNESIDSSAGVIQKEFNNSGFPRQIAYHGPVHGPEKDRALKETDIFCFPSFFKYEAFPLVILEAMRQGLPVVATDHAGIPEAIDDGLGGFLVRKEDIDDLSMKLEMVIGNKRLRERMGAYNREKFLKEFTIEKHVEKWVTLLREKTI